jgi:hypothetical protein
VSGQSEKRHFPRREFLEEVYCYIDGQRLDAVSINISIGGLLFETDKANAIEMGALVAIVLRARDDKIEPEPVFLFGRVVRKQVDGPSGVGVRWEKAVARGSKERLGLYLKNVLEVRAFGIESGLVPRTGHELSVYRFVPESVTEGPRIAENPVGAALFEDESDEAWRSYDEDGPITEGIRRDRIPADADLSATMSSAGEASFAGRVTMLGIEDLLFETPQADDGSEGERYVQFTLPTKAGFVDVMVRGPVMKYEAPDETQPGRFTLKINDRDEASRPGIIGRYVRWLHYRDVASD